MASERLVIKVGTNVLTQPSNQLDFNAIHHIVEQIGTLCGQGHNVVLVTSGAAGAGSSLADFGREKNPLVRRMMMTAVGQSRLMQIYADFFREYNIVVAQALLTRSDIADRAHYLNVRNVFEGLLRARVLPIINENDVVASEALTFGDNDFLAAAVASIIGAHRLFLLTTADGFYLGGDPAAKRGTKLVAEAPEITQDMWDSCGISIAEGGRGGMLSKLKAVEMATSFGIQAHIASGREPDVVPRIMAGETIGTVFTPRAKRLKSYRQWLRIGPRISGKLIVDDGAARALHNNKSLLPAGIAKVEGDFQNGDVVEIFNRDREKVGVGQVNIASADLAAIIRGDTPKGPSQEAIHKDKLLVVG